MYIVDFKGQFLIVFLDLYPELSTKIKYYVDAYSYSGFSWWQKLLKIHEIGNKIGARLLLEDRSIVENLYTTFNKKLTLKNDTIVELAMNYLQSWD